MMWQIDSSKIGDQPELVLIQAIQYYTEKYGAVPNRCEIPPDWAKELVVPDGMTLTRSRTVQKGHLMLALDPELDPQLPG